MSDFNNIFKKALEGHEVPFDPAMWDKVSSQLSPVEDAFRKSVENHEAPYDPKAWSAIKGQIGSSSLIQWVAGSAAAAGLIAGIIAFLPGSDSDSDKVEGISHTKIENNTPVLFSADKPTTTEELIAAESHTAISTPQDETTHEVINHTIPSDELVDNSKTVNNGDENQSDSNSQTAENQNSGNTENNEAANEFTDNAGSGSVEDISRPVSAVQYNAEFSCSQTEICAGEEILLNPKVIREGVVYDWHFGDGTTSTSPHSAHTFAEASNYQITLNVRDKKSNALLASSQQSVLVKQLPDAQFTSASNDDIIPAVNFTGLSESADNFIWKVNDRVISDRKQFEYTFREKGKYTVELLATNELGCERKNEKQFMIEEDYNLLAPTAFSPNGDGQNETFIPFALTLTDNEFTMTIYNQAGKLIYHTVNANSPWDGSDITNNSNAPDGAYIWMVRLKNGNGTYENYKGQVFITP